MTKLTRRDFIRLAGAGAATAVITACSPNAPAPTATSLPDTALPQATLPPPAAIATEGFVPDVEFALNAVQETAVIFPGTDTNVWRYTGELMKGEANALQPIPDSYLGPILRVRKGQKVRIHFTNDLPETSIIHWHGLHIPANMDGHPQYVIDNGQTYVYEFEVRNRAGMYWYHPHPHGRTGSQVYAGMAGLFLVSDDEEDAANLPSGEYDIPLVLQDRTFKEDGQLSYMSNGMMDMMMGTLGDEMLVNGKPDATLPVATRAYRLRFLNGSNSRIYKLGWEDGTPFTVIGTDGGLLEKPVERPYLTLAPAERVEIWVDFNGRSLGSEMKLISQPFTAGEIRGGQFPILTVKVEREATDNVSLPAQLSTPAFHDVSESERTRTVELMMDMGVGSWTLNGRVFEMTAVTEDEIVQMGAIETWEYRNDVASSGGGMGMMNMTLPHPIHMHGEQFQVISREINDDGKAGWDTLSEGFVDEGWKDVVLVMPGERVKVLRRFGDYAGLYLYHCHNLEHEDMGMMRNFEVRA